MSYTRTPQMTNDKIKMTNNAFAISGSTFVILVSSFVISQWGVKDLNLRRHCHQIYSLTPLTTRETPLVAQRQSTNGEIRMTNRTLSVNSFVIRHSCFVIELAEGLEPTTC